MTSIFISHSSVDNDAASAMKAWLEQQGHTSLFLDFDPEAGIQAGSDWEETLYYRLRHCNAVIALLTPNWLASKWCFAEVMQAREKGKPIFPVKVQACDAAGLLGDVQHIDLTGKPAEGYRRLALGLKSRGLDPLDVFDWKPDRPPYPGLLAFQEEDAAVFFGRSHEVLNGLETLNALRRQGRDAPRFVLFLGASGSGKSSLVRAGIIPRLKKTPSEWLVLAPFRPQDDPLRELAISLAAGFETHGQPRAYAEIEQQLKLAATETPADGRALLTLVRELTLAARQREASVVLTIDQAEELFGYSAKDAADQFLRLLRASLDLSDRQLIVTATLRSDFLGEFQSNRALHDPGYDRDFQYQAVTVDRMPERNFAEIIQGPARVAGLRLEDGLVEAMVGDTVTHDALPLLAFTLRRLFERSGQDGLLDIREYDELGRLEGAIRLEADRVLADASASIAELEALRAAFVPTLVRINADGAYARRRAYADQIPAQAEALLRRFVDARLLITDRDQDGRETLEVAHEALLRTWPQLATWLAEDQDDLRLLESMRRSAEEWDSGGRNEDLLVHRDGRLEDLRTLVEKPRFALQAAPLEKSYLDASIAAQRIRESAEREAQERRILDAERLAEEQKKAALAQKKTTQRTFIGLVAALALAIVVGVVGWLALQAAAAAELQARISDARRLAAKANTALINNDAPLSLLLSVEAYRAYDNYETRDSLLTALERSPHLIAVLRGHTSGIGGTGVRSVAFNPDGTLLASAGTDGRLLLWDVQQRRQLAGPLATHTNDIARVAFDPTGKIVASAGIDGLWLWDAETGVPLAHPEGIVGPEFGGGILAIAFSPDGKTVAFGGSDQAVRLWDVVNGRLIGNPFEGYQGSVTGIAISKDGRLASSGCKPSGHSTCAQSELRLRDMASGQPVGRPIAIDTGGVTSIALSPDGRTLAAGNIDSTVRLWSAANGTEIGRPLTGHTGEVNSVSFSPDGSILASASSDATVRLWNVAKQQRVGEPLVAHQGRVTSVSFSPDGKTLASGSDDNTVILWRLETDGPISAAMPDPPSGAQSVAFSPDGGLLAAGGSDATLTVFDVDLHRMVGRWLVADPAVRTAGTSTSMAHKFVNGLAFSPDGTFLASGSLDGTIAFWRAPDGASFGPNLQFPGQVRRLAFSPDGKLLAAGGSGKIVLWDVATRAELGPAWEKHIGDVYSIAFSPDGETLASVGPDGAVILWNVASGEPVGDPLTTKGRITGVSFSPDGLTLASADTGGNIVIWNVETGKAFRNLSSGQTGFASIAFSSDGKVLASGSDDRTLVLWDAVTWTPLVHPLSTASKTPNIMDVAFSPKRPLAAAALWDGNVVLWDASLDAWEELACRTANRNLTTTEWKQVSEDAPYRKTCPELPVDPSLYQPAMEALREHARASSQSGNRAQALADLTQAIGLVAEFDQEAGFVSPPQLLEAYMERGVVHYVGGDMEAAIADWAAAGRLRPRDARPHAYLGFAYYELDRVGDAVASWRTAVKLNPTNDDSWAGLGIAFYDSGDNEQAIAAYRRALAITPDYNASLWAEDRPWSEKAVRHVDALMDLVRKAPPG